MKITILSFADAKSNLNFSSIDNDARRRVSRRTMQTMSYFCISRWKIVLVDWSGDGGISTPHLELYHLLASIN